MADFIAAALRYVELGFGVLPVGQGPGELGKKGFIEGGWKAAAHDAFAAELLFADHPGKNLALVLPPHLCVIDVDPRNGGNESLLRWEDEHGPLPETVMSQTGRGGRHLYFRCDPARKLRTTMGDGLDVLAAGKGQVVEWPSVTLAPYEWITSPENGEYADLPEPCYAPPEPERRANGHGSSQPDDSIRKYCWTALANEKQRLATTLKGGRNAALNNAALALGHLAHYHAYGIDEARIALRNACLDNGLIGDDGDASFATTFASGWAKGEQEPKTIEPRQGYTNGQGAPQTTPAPTKAKAPAEAPIKFSATTLDGQEFAPVEWLIEGILPTGLAILAGKSKIGKSWLAMDTAIMLALGAQAFSKVNTHQTDVLYVALEDGRRRLQSRMRKLLAGKAAPDNLVFATEWPRVGDGCFEHIEAHLDANPKCRCVIIDTFGKVRGNPSSKTSNVYQQDYGDMGEFHALAQRRNITLLLIHHTRKQDATDVMDLISGSTGIVGAADTLMVLQRKRGDLQGIFAVTGRDIIDDGEFAVSFDKDTGKWTMLGEAKEIKAETTQDAIFQFLHSEEEPHSPSSIADALDLGRSYVKLCLNRLKKKGTVIKSGRGLWTIAGRNSE